MKKLITTALLFTSFFAFSQGRYTLKVSTDTSTIANFYTKVRSLFSATAPVTYVNGLIGITQSTTSVNGYLSSTDWNTFNNKQSALSGTGYSKWSGSTPSYLTPTQVTADLNLFTTSLKGLVPSGGSAAKVLHGDGTWRDTTISGRFGLEDLTTPSDRLVNLNGHSLRLTGSGGTLDFSGVLQMYDGTGVNSYISPAYISAIDNTGGQNIKTTLRGGYLTWEKSTAQVTTLRSVEATSSNKTSYIPNGNGVLALSVNGTAADSTGNITLSVGGSGTVANVDALTLGTTGTDLSSSVANSTTTPVITLNVPTASASNRGALSSADWSTFNNKVGSVVLNTPGTIYTNPINFTTSGGVSTGTLSLISQTANTILAAPNGSSGTPSFRSLVSADFPTSPSFTTPNINVATATSVNKVSITAPATSATLTLAQGSTLATSGANSITLTSTGATNVTVPTTGTLATTSKVYFTALATHSSMTPAANSTYYFGSAVFGFSASSAVTSRQMIVPFDCTLVGYSLTVFGNTTSTSETSTYNFRLNNTTDVLLSNAVNFNSTAGIPLQYYGTGLSTSLTAGDKYEIKWTTPTTWATIPTNSINSIILYFQPR